MAVSELLRLVVEADTRGAVKGMEKVGSTAQRELSRSQQSLDRWGNRLTTLGAGMVTFGTVAAYGLARAGQAAGDLEQAVGGTEAVFGDASGKIDEYGRAAAKNAGLSKTEFRIATTQIGGNLKRMGFDVDEAADKSIDLTQVAADLAATYGGTTAEAVQALGAAFRGEADPAERFNLDLKVSKVNAEAVALGLATSTSAVDDHARAQALLSLIMKQSADAQGQYGRESDTLAGRQQTLAAEFENLKASIGEGALPVMEDLFGIAQGGIKAFQGLDDATNGFVGKAATLGTIATLGLGGLSLLIGQAIKMRDNFTAARHAITRFRGSLSGLGIAAGVAGGVAAIGLAIENMNREARRSEADRLTKEFLATGEALEVLEGNWEGNYDASLKVTDVFEQLVQSNTVAAERFIETAEAAGTSAEMIEWMTAKLEEQKAANDQTSSDQEVLAGTSGEVADGMDGVAGSTADATSALQEYADTLRAQFDPLFAYQDAVTANKDALDEEAAAQAELDLLRASGEATAEDLKEAEDRLAAAHGDVQSSAVDLAGREAELMDMLAEGGRTADEMRAELDRLEEQGYLSAAAAADLRRKIDAIESKTVEANLLDGVSSVVDRINEKMKQLKGKDVTVRTNYVTTGTRGSGGVPLGAHDGERALGGPVAAGRLYEVAEQGRAELLEMGGRTYLIPGSSGTVIPADAMAAPTAGAAGGAGSGPVVINLNGPIGSEAEAARWVGRALKAAGQSGQSLTVNGRRVA